MIQGPDPIQTNSTTEKKPPQPPSEGRLWDIVVLFAVSVAYLSLSLYQLSLPGLYGDELDKLVPTVNLLTHQPFVTIAWSVTVLGFRVILSFTDRIGSVLCYIPMPFIMVFGYTAFALRFSTVVCGLLTLWFAYLGAKIWCGTWAARFGVILAAVSPGYIFLQRMGSYNYGPVTLFTSISFWFLARYRVRRNAWDLWGCAIAAGVALNTALQAVFVLIPMALLAIFFHKPLKAQIGRLLAAAVIFFIVGSPVLITGLRTGAMLDRIGWTDKANLSQALATPMVSETLKKNTGHVVEMLSGLDGVQEGAIGGHVEDVWMPRLLVLGIVLTLVGFVVAKSKLQFILRDGTCLIISAVGLFLSALIVNGQGISYELLVLWPFVIFVIGSGFAAILERWRPLGYVSVALLCAVVVTQARTTIEAHRLLTQNRGRDYTTSQVYPLVDYLKTLRNTRVITMEWGQLNQIYYLSGGGIMPESLHGWWPKGTEPPDDFKNAISQRVPDPGNLYIFFGPGHGVSDRFDDVKKLAEAGNKQLKVEKIFYENDGAVAYRLARIVDKDAAQ